MDMKFEIKDRDASGRICNFITDHGKVTTPNLMPVINPNRLLISPKEMKKLFGTQIVITNSYIIKKDEKLKEKSLKEGVHKLIDFDGPIMTDSGTFQSYVYGDIKLDPVEIVEFQRDIGSDIGTILDIFSTLDKSKKQIEDGVVETVKRAKKSMKFKGDMNLACTVQGSIYSDLRYRCAQELSKIDADFYPIGGVVPLMEQQRYSDLVISIVYSKMGLKPGKPIHLFGCGHPLIFPLAVALGCDFFDSSAYAKYAQDDRLIFYWGTEKLQDLDELPCLCPVCSKYSAKEIKRLDKKTRAKEIAKHNLYVSYNELKKIRTAIKKGNLWELVERRASCNPYLFESIKILRSDKVKKYLERFEQTSKDKALFYTGSHTVHRPIVNRVHNKIVDRYRDVKTNIVFPESDKPYSFTYSSQIKKIRKKNTNIGIIVDSCLGPVPIELDEMYPFAQSVFPEITDSETEDEILKMYEVFSKDKKMISWAGDEVIKDLEKNVEEEFNFDKRRIGAVCDIQFSKDASKALLSGKVRIVKSKKTDKIRNVYCDGKHILSMRAGDGLFTLKIQGAKILHKSFKSPILRVVVDSEVAEFIRDGKSVFAKFVRDCDKNLRPYDECLIVDEKDNLLACGRCLMNKEEMLSFNYGTAVKNRENI